eukprot:COSAG02_NODE_24196_length_695_cov_1.172819_1_plen_32_part_10
MEVSPAIVAAVVFRHIVHRVHGSRCGRLRRSF